MNPAENNEVIMDQEVYYRRARWMRIAIVLLFFLFVYIRVWIYVIDIGSIYLTIVYALSNLAILLAYFYWLRRRLRDQNHIQDFLGPAQLNNIHGREGPNRLTDDDIARLKTSVYCSEDQVSLHRLESDEEQTSSAQVPREEPMCSICLSEFVTGDLLISLDCYHSYHYGCIHDWLTIRNFCPMCKTIVIPVNNPIVDNNNNNDDSLDVVYEVQSEDSHDALEEHAGRRL